MIAVTTFSKEGYKTYGRNMLESFVKHWPCDIVVYYEDEMPDFEHEKILYLRFFDITHVVTFYNYIRDNPAARGIFEDGYDYNFDVWKFSRKMFCQFQAIANHKGKVFWLDADTITHKDVPEEFLEDLFDDRCLVYLGREGFYTETGFVGFDTEHEDIEPFLDKYVDTLKKGLIFTLERWHDCQAFDYAREGISGVNLSDWWKQGKALDVLTKTVLAEYLIHNKGDRKFH